MQFDELVVAAGRAAYAEIADREIRGQRWQRGRKKAQRHPYGAT
jgi:hypothetical protein